MALLDDNEIQQRLERSEWRREGDAIVRDFKFKDFAEAMEFVNVVAGIAEERNHHPDIDIRWRNLTFRCSTHSAGGLTELDTALAAAISEEITAAGG
jgi:4a-hydroxytetrahydrobiopterin dehydratase